MKESIMFHDQAYPFVVVWWIFTLKRAQNPNMSIIPWILRGKIAAMVYILGLCERHI
jgi:hypothetical protein